jgi:replicative DNA helicase
LEWKGVAELGIPTGLVDLDRILGFLEPGELTVVAARPGCGKSSILRQISYAVAAGGRRVSLVSTEMGAREIVLAAARQISGVAWAKGRELPPSERDSFKSAVQRISTMAAMRLTEARQLVQVVAKWRAMMDEEIHPALFVVDYLQQLDAGMRKGETLAAAVGRITGELKAFAKDHRVVVLAAAQLNRESVKDGEPQLYHLRDSGAIEQDADRVIMLKLSDNDKPDERWATVEVFQRKNRNGPLGTCRLAFDRWTTKFTNYAP